MRGNDVVSVLTFILSAKCNFITNRSLKIGHGCALNLGLINDFSM